MVYSFWAVLVLIVVIVALTIRRTKVKYLEAKAEEQKVADAEARMRPRAEEGLMPERNQGQRAPKQGEFPDLSRMLGQKGVH